MHAVDLIRESVRRSSTSGVDERVGGPVDVTLGVANTPDWDDVRVRTNRRRHMSRRVAVIGAGSWGTCFASVCARNNPTALWVRPEEFDVADEINSAHMNSSYLAGTKLPTGLVATTDMSDAVAGADCVVIGIPSRWIRDVLRDLRDHVEPQVPIVSLVKGLEADTNLRMTEVIAEEIPGHGVGAISGPNLASEIALGIASASVLAFADIETARELRTLFNTPRFRVYVNHDVVGVEAGGALKNVIAIATGMSDGAGGGDNTRAAIITRGLAEITRVGVAMGAEAQTFAGLAGVGDLVATCTSTRSRNHFVGEALGRGRKLDDILAEMTQVAEGVTTAPVVLDIAAAHRVAAPICSAINAVLEDDMSPSEAVASIRRHEAGHELEAG
jgi:glycerol-3-phosphate dehydrogenase (NAD(P)+)